MWDAALPRDCVWFLAGVVPLLCRESVRGEGLGGAGCMICVSKGDGAGGEGQWFGVGSGGGESEGGGWGRSSCAVMSWDPIGQLMLESMARTARSLIEGFHQGMGTGAGG